MSFEQELEGVLQKLSDKEVIASREKQLREFVVEKVSDDIMSVISRLQRRFNVAKYNRSGAQSWSFEVNGHTVKLIHDEIVHATIGGNNLDVALLQQLVENDYKGVIENLIIEKLRSQI